MMINTTSNYQLLLLLAIVLITPTLISSTTPVQDFTIAKRNCTDRCGNIKIPFPFGTTPDCYANNKSFLVTCNYSSNQPNAPILFLGDTEIPVTDISLSGQLRIMKRVAKICYSRNGTMVYDFEPMLDLPFLLTVNNTVNKFTVIGCDSYGYLSGRRWWSKYYSTGCIATCLYTDELEEGSCQGSGCCQTSSFPANVWRLNLELGSFHNHTNVSMFNNCTYAFLVEEKAFRFHPGYLTSFNNIEKLPLVLDWVISNMTCKSARMNSSSYACVSQNSECYEPPNSIGYRCQCMTGYQGNPYLIDGCQDIDECQSSKLSNCTYSHMCENLPGNFKCHCPEGGHLGNGIGVGGCYCRPGYTDNGEKGCHCPKRFRRKGGCFPGESQTYPIITGVALGIVVVLLVIWLLYFELKRQRSNKMKDVFFQQNGGILLQEKLKAAGGRGTSANDHMAKIFSSAKLCRATDNFHNSMIIGQGGFGTVYKGCLENNNLVAIKKSKEVDPSQIEQFINEFMILSQISHRNVVKLLGCCLETEVPLLVYEFINNGTLYDHLHKHSRRSVLVWNLRLKIAIETAHVLSYLHSAASTPIIHRDVKSANILLDGDFNAKVSDFGASRLVPMDQTQLPTMVLGTLGYLDPQYMQTHQLTDKSDVYSFGVVLVELMSGKKVINYDRPEDEKSLSSFFLRKLKQGRLFDVLDQTMDLNENEEQQVIGVATLAQVCLNVRGEERPSMREVAMELESLKSGGRRSWAKQEHNGDDIKSSFGEGYSVKSFSHKGFDGFVDIGDYSTTTSMSYGSLRVHDELSGGR